jgi:hypothetical protein
VVIVKAASVYQVNVPVAQALCKVEVSPVQIGLLLLVANEGPRGVGVTVTVTAAVGLLQAPSTQAA